MDVAVIGLGMFGKTLAFELEKKGVSVLAIDNDMEAIEDVKNSVTMAIRADATDIKALMSAGVQDMDAAVVALGKSTGESVIVTMNLRKLGVSKIYARALDKEFEQTLKDVGAHYVFTIEWAMGKHIAELVASPYVLEFISFPGDYSLLEIYAPSEWEEKSIIELKTRQKYGVNIVAIKKKVPHVDEMGKSTFRIVTNTLPKPSDVIKGDDILVLMGPTEKIKNFIK